MGCCHSTVAVVVVTVAVMGCFHSTVIAIVVVTEHCCHGLLIAIAL